MLWSLPKAAPALIRHLVGYAELAEQDLEVTKKDWVARCVALALVGVCVLFALLSAFLLVLALTWDTSYRVSAILWMGGTFIVLALAAGLYCSKIIGAEAPFLGTVKREWAEDRVILDRILSDQD